MSYAAQIVTQEWLGKWNTMDNERISYIRYIGIVLSAAAAILLFVEYRLIVLGR